MRFGISAPSCGMRFVVKGSVFSQVHAGDRVTVCRAEVQYYLRIYLLHTIPKILELSISAKLPTSWLRRPRPGSSRAQRRRFVASCQLCLNAAHAWNPVQETLLLGQSCGLLCGQICGSERAPQEAQPAEVRSTTREVCRSLGATGSVDVVTPQQLFQNAGCWNPGWLLMVCAICVSLVGWLLRTRMNNIE